MQDGLHADLPDLLELVLQQARKDVPVWIAHELEEPSAMHVLERRLVVVPQGQIVGRLHEVDVVQAWMPDVVADGADQQAEALGAVEVLLGHATVQEPVDAVRHVHCMVPVVVGQRLDVRLLDSLQELPHYAGVEGHVVVQLAHEVRGCGLVPRPVQFQGVEAVRVDERQREPGILDHQLLHAAHLLLVYVLIGVRPDGVHARQRPLALEAADDRAVALAEALYELRVDRGLRHGYIAEDCQLRHHPLE
mmetsp:Transcript_108941/g.351712  ORF Transcript_108941/g.351712 Transcript_108941/m.351712 type:complete len:249 (-) Transcript_108941:409-1155(-)